MNKTNYTSDFFNDLPVKPKIVPVDDPWLGGTGYCLFDFDTPEQVDCYSVGEMKALRDLLDTVICKHEEQKVDPLQMTLWPELSEEYL